MQNRSGHSSPIHDIPNLQLPQSQTLLQTPPITAALAVTATPTQVPMHSTSQQTLPKHTESVERDGLTGRCAYRQAIAKFKRERREGASYYFCTSVVPRNFIYPLLIYIFIYLCHAVTCIEIRAASFCLEVVIVAQLVCISVVSSGVAFLMYDLERRLFLFCFRRRRKKMRDIDRLSVLVM